MNHPLRRLLATCAVSAVAAGVTMLPSAAASAADVSCDNPDALKAAVVSAEDALTQARADAKAAHRPLGRLVSAKRHEARTELRTSRAALRELRTEARSATPDERRALREQIKAERVDIAHARNLLEDKRALLAEIKADRRTARFAVQAARATLSELQEIEAGCHAQF